MYKYILYIYVCEFTTHYLLTKKLKIVSVSIWIKYPNISFVIFFFNTLQLDVFINNKYELRSRIQFQIKLNHV